MAITNLSLVNQKLAYTRSLLKVASSLPSPSNASEHLRQQALLDGAVFHLACAYHHYLHEFAENYRVKDVTQVNNEQDLIDVLAVIGKESAEAQELRSLREQSLSWLNQLQTYYQSLWKPPLVEMGSVKNSLDNLAFDVTDIRMGISLELVTTWEGMFSAMAARHREAGAEY